MNTPSHIAIYRLAAGRAIALTGFEAGWIALMVTVYAKTHSTVWMSGALFVAIGTSGIATPIAGALGDRYDRRRVMIASELAAAGAATAMAFTDQPAPLIALAALVGLAEAPFLPASNAAIPNLVPNHRLEWANSTLAVGRNLGELVGPAARRSDHGRDRPVRRVPARRGRIPGLRHPRLVGQGAVQRR